jgi:hypothetical protein
MSTADSTPLSNVAGAAMNVTFRTASPLRQIALALHRARYSITLSACNPVGEAKELQIPIEPPPPVPLAKQTRALTGACSP